MSADKRPEHHKRDLLLSDRISQGTVKDIIKDIFEINFDDDEKEEIYKDWERKPIQLFINSYGGSVYDGLALIDVIKRSKTPVHTVCIGSCMSMALWIWLAGEMAVRSKTLCRRVCDTYVSRCLFICLRQNGRNQAGIE